MEKLNSLQQNQVQNQRQVSHVLNFTSQCAIQSRLVPLKVFPQQVENLVMAIALIDREVCKGHFSKDVKNKILQMCINDIAGPGPALHHLLKDTKNAVFLSQMLEKFEIKPAVETKALQALEEKHLFREAGKKSIPVFRKHFDLKNAEGNFSSSPDVTDKEFLLGIFHFMVQFRCLPSQFDQKSIDAITDEQRAVYSGYDDRNIGMSSSIKREGDLLHLPINVTKASVPETLYLSNSKISSLPLQLANLITLNCLDISHTNITALPIVIALLNRLTVLKLNHTDVSELPNWITNLPLKELHIEHTKITLLSAFFREMFPKLSLYCANTPLNREGEQGKYLLEIDTYSQSE